MIIGEDIRGTGKPTSRVCPSYPCRGRRLPRRIGCSARAAEWAWSRSASSMPVRPMVPSRQPRARHRRGGRVPSAVPLPDAKQLGEMVRTAGLADTVAEARTIGLRLLSARGLVLALASGGSAMDDVMANVPVERRWSVLSDVEQALTRFEGTGRAGRSPGLRVVTAKAGASRHDPPAAAGYALFADGPAGRTTIERIWLT